MKTLSGGNSILQVDTGYTFAQVKQAFDKDGWEKIKLIFSGKILNVILILYYLTKQDHEYVRDTKLKSGDFLVCMYAPTQKSNNIIDIITESDTVTHNIKIDNFKSVFFIFAIQ